MSMRDPVSVAAAGALTAALGFLTPGPAVAAPTAAEAQAFVAKAEADLAADNGFQNRAGWTSRTSAMPAAADG